MVQTVVQTGSADEVAFVVVACEEVEEVASLLLVDDGVVVVVFVAEVVEVNSSILVNDKLGSMTSEHGGSGV